MKHYLQALCILPLTGAWVASAQTPATPDHQAVVQALDAMQTTLDQLQREIQQLRNSLAPAGSRRMRPMRALAAVSAKVQAETCTDLQDFRDCHANFPTGCTDSDNPRYDAYLNFLKNQTPDPASVPVRVLTPDVYQTLEQNVPDGLGQGNHGQFGGDLANAPLNEGEIDAVVGFIYYVEVTSTPETSNCKLTGDQNSDYHIAIGFDPAIAQRLQNGETIDKQQLQQNSVIAEMTPHYRAQFHPEWVSAQLISMAGSQVKATGQLMIDNQHYNASQDCGFAFASPDSTKCWRLSVWELHPVTRFQVCPSNQCTPDSADWKDFGAQ